MDLFTSSLPSSLNSYHVVLEQQVTWIAQNWTHMPFLLALADYYLENSQTNTYVTLQTTDF